jgi:hypothetical protein
LESLAIEKLNKKLSEKKVKKQIPLIHKRLNKENSPQITLNNESKIMLDESSLSNLINKLVQEKMKDKGLTIQEKSNADNKENTKNSENNCIKENNNQTINNNIKKEIKENKKKNNKHQKKHIKRKNKTNMNPSQGFLVITGSSGTNISNSKVNNQNSKNSGLTSTKTKKHNKNTYYDAEIRKPTPPPKPTPHPKQNRINRKSNSNLKERKNKKLK